MKNLFLILFLIPLLCVARTTNNVYRMGTSGNVPSWGQVNLSDSGKAVTNGGLGQINNAAVTASVSANALTISLKQSDASTDATAANPINIPFRSSTIGNGSFSNVLVTAALSLVISSGSTLGHTNATLGAIYVYALNNSGSAELAASNSPVDERILQTTVAEGGAGAADSNSTIYSTTARSNVAVRLLGILQSTQTTAGTWATAPSVISNATRPHPIFEMPLRQALSSVGIGGVALSASSGGFQTSSTSFVAVTNMSVTIVTTGRPVWVGTIDDNGGTSYCGPQNGTASHTVTAGRHRYLRDGSAFSTQYEEVDDETTSLVTKLLLPNCAGVTDYLASAGSHTYTMEAECFNSSANCTAMNVIDLRLIAYEQ